MGHAPSTPLPRATQPATSAFNAGPPGVRQISAPVLRTRDRQPLRFGKQRHILRDKGAYYLATISSGQAGLGRPCFEQANLIQIHYAEVDPEMKRVQYLRPEDLVAAASARFDKADGSRAVAAGHD